MGFRVKRRAENAEVQKRREGVRRGKKSAEKDEWREERGESRGRERGVRGVWRGGKMEGRGEREFAEGWECGKSQKTLVVWVGSVRSFMLKGSYYL